MFMIFCFLCALTVSKIYLQLLHIDLKMLSNVLQKHSVKIVNKITIKMLSQVLPFPEFSCAPEQPDSQILYWKLSLFSARVTPESCGPCTILFLRTGTRKDHCGRATS